MKKSLYLLLSILLLNLVSCASSKKEILAKFGDINVYAVNEDSLISLGKKWEGTTWNVTLISCEENELLSISDAPKGSKVIVAEFTYEPAKNEPTIFTPGGILLFANGTYYAPDADLSYQYSTIIDNDFGSVKNVKFNGDIVNPGISIRYYYAFIIPKNINLSSSSIGLNSTKDSGFISIWKIQ